VNEELNTCYYPNILFQTSDIRTSKFTQKRDVIKKEYPRCNAYGGSIY